MTRRSTIDPTVMAAAAEAYAFKAKIEAAEAERDQPDTPWLAITVLLLISASAYLVGLLLFPEVL